MKKLILLVTVLIIFVIISRTKSTDSCIQIYFKDGQNESIKLNEINSINIKLIDSLSWIHIFYKDNNQHFIYSAIGLDSIGVNHQNNTISILRIGIIEIHRIEDIEYIKINCEKLIIPHDQYEGETYYYNPDSVMVDSCQIPPAILTRKWFNIQFDNYVIDLPEGPKDTILDVSWESISTSYPLIRNEFEEMEILFGNYTLRKPLPQITDTTHLGSRYFLICFDDYINMDSVLSYLSKCHGISEFWYTNNVKIGI